MCWKKSVCINYQMNTIHGNYDACGNCEYIKKMLHTQKISKICLGVCTLCFMVITYLLF